LAQELILFRATANDASREPNNTLLPGESESAVAILEVPRMAAALHRVTLLVVATTGASGARARLESQDEVFGDVSSHSGVNRSSANIQSSWFGSSSSDSSGSSSGDSGPPRGIVRWSSCFHLRGTISTVSTWCFGISPFASHCFDVVELEDTRAMLLELYGWGKNAAVACHYLGYDFNKWRKTHSLELYSDLETSYEVEAQQPPKPAQPCLARWADKGYDDSKCFNRTVAGLLEYVNDYLSKFPAYGALSTNCQKFSVGVYNALTHSHEEERQRSGMKFLDFFR